MDVEWSKSYKQEYTYDGFFNMTRKDSSEISSLDTGKPSEFDYDLSYVYSS